MGMQLSKRYSYKCQTVLVKLYEGAIAGMGDKGYYISW